LSTGYSARCFVAIITISRGTMSGGRKLAEMLADSLGYRCVSREVIIKTADAYGIAESKLFEAIQKSPSILQKFTFEREHYLAFIQATLCEYAKDDNLIYHGHAGHLLLEGIDHVLRVRIVSDMVDRVKAAVEQFNFSEKEALKYIARIDKQRVKWTKFLYGRDWRSPEMYDIVFNLRGMGHDFVCAMIKHAVAQPQFQTTPASKLAMESLLITSRVRATLAGMPGMRLEYIDVEADGGRVVIRGRTKSQELVDAILDEAASVPGVDDVESQMEIDYRDYKIE
jgi:cytidylate kinase